LIKESLIKELEYLILPCFASANVELIDLICRQEGRKLIIRILADYPQDGITLDECAMLNRRLGELLDEKNIIPCEYILEVSSPGLDRSLKRKKDFLRCLNREVVFFLNDFIDGKCQWQGVVAKADEACVFIQSAEKIIEIPLTKINKAQLVINK
jgi:ribosome maturation factor RimP